MFSSNRSLPSKRSGGLDSCLHGTWPTLDHSHETVIGTALCGRCADKGGNPGVRFTVKEIKSITSLALSSVHVIPFLIDLECLCLCAG